MPLAPSFSPARLARLCLPCLAALCLACAWPVAAAAQAAGGEKAARTPAQKKIDSQLLYALYERRGERARKGTPKSEVEVDARGRVLVDIRARVSGALLARVRRLGGEVVSSSETYHTILARFPVERLEALAARAEVVFIGPAAKATTN